MSTDVDVPAQDPNQMIGLLKNEELIELLIKHNNLHDGVYALALELQVAIGSFGTDVDSITPGAMFGVKGVGLVKTELGYVGAKTVDAAVANPKPKARKNSSDKK